LEGFRKYRADDISKETTQKGTMNFDDILENLMEILIKGILHNRTLGLVAKVLFELTSLACLLVGLTFSI
jgi:hypothetical protein